MGGFGSRVVPPSITKLWSSEYHGPVTSDAGGVALMTDIVADQMAGDAKLHVGFQKLVVLHVDLRDQRLEAVLGGEEMQMRGAHVVAPLRAQQVAGRSVDRDRIARRLDAAECDVAVGIGGELAAQVHVGLHRVLVLVETFGR